MYTGIVLVVDYLFIFKIIQYYIKLSNIYFSFRIMSCLAFEGHH